MKKKKKRKNFETQTTRDSSNLYKEGQRLTELIWNDRLSTINRLNIPSGLETSVKTKNEYLMST